MIDANDLLIVMNILKFPITNQEAEEMIKFADHDKGIRIIIILSNKFIFNFFKDLLLSFDEFLTVLTQISAINHNSS